MEQQLATEQTMVIVTAHGAKVRRAIKRYNSIVSGMEPCEVPDSYEAANGIFRHLELGDDRVSRKVDVDCVLFPRSLKKQIEAGVVREVQSSDRMLKFFVRCKAPRFAVAAVDERSRLAVTLDRVEASITPGEMNIYAGRHFRGGKTMRDRNGRDDVVRRTAAKVDTFTTTH